MHLVITGDPHGRAVFSSLIEPKALIDTQLPFSCAFSIANGEAPWRFEITQNGYDIDITQLRVVYMRRPIMPDPSSFNMPLAAAEFAQREWEQVTEGVAAICCFLSGRRLITLGRLPQLASNKIVQLILAKQVGLLIPDTHITTYPDSAKSFCEQDSTIYKTLSIPVVDFRDGGRSMIYTSKVNILSFERVRLAPCLFQRNIAKDYEVRVAVVGDQVIAVKLDSQLTKETSQDWRHAMRDVISEVITLPADIQTSLVELHKRLHIPWGMADLIVDEDGKYIFLETNPDGAWLWLEHKLGSSEITEALVRCIQKDM